MAIQPNFYDIATKNDFFELIHGHLPRESVASLRGVCRSFSILFKERILSERLFISPCPQSKLTDDHSYEAVRFPCKITERYIYLAEVIQKRYQPGTNWFHEFVHTFSLPSGDLLRDQYPTGVKIQIYDRDSGAHVRKLPIFMLTPDLESPITQENFTAITGDHASVYYSLSGETVSAMNIENGRLSPILHFPTFLKVLFFEFHIIAIHQEGITIHNKKSGERVAKLFPKILAAYKTDGDLIIICANNVFVLYDDSLKVEALGIVPKNCLQYFVGKSEKYFVSKNGRKIQIRYLATKKFETLTLRKRALWVELFDEELIIILQDSLIWYNIRRKVHKSIQLHREISAIISYNEFYILGDAKRNQVHFLYVSETAFHLKTEFICTSGNPGVKHLLIVDERVLVQMKNRTMHFLDLSERDSGLHTDNESV